MNTYHDAMKKFIGEPLACGYGIWDISLLNAAEEIDRTRINLCNDSRRMAERFNNFAYTIEGGFFTDSPATYSTINDITVGTARLRELGNGLKVLLRLRYNSDEIKSFYDILSLRGVQSHG